MSVPTHPAYPVRVDATLDDRLSRWLWLVKWFLLIPHYVVLFFLWIAFTVLSAVALVAILVTGRYPRSLFDFNVGVLRWTWRVSFYAYGGLGTDHYPPFTLAEVPGYPAHLEIEYPAQLSRGLVLVKWWLLAIPHYLVVGLFIGSGWYVAANGTDVDTELASGGLIGLLVLIAAVVLLFTGRYPRPVFDLVLGLNRWVLRVAAYAALMTDAYPPFRLDMGGSDPGHGPLAFSPEVGTRALPDQPAGPPTAPAPTPPAGAAPAPTPPPAEGGTWSAGRVVAVVAASLLAFVGVGMMAAGGAVRLADAGLRDESGYLMTSSVDLESPGYALTSEEVQLHDGLALVDLPSDWLGTVKVEVRGHTNNGVFVGVGRSEDVAAYLDGVATSVVVDPVGDDGDTPLIEFTDGGSPPVSPTDAGFWVTSASGDGIQSVTWEAEEGDWTLVVMNGEGTTPVVADVAVGATVPSLGAIALTLLIAGLLACVVAGFLIFLAAPRSARNRVG